MFQNVFMDLKILKEKQIFLYFSMSFGIFVSFQFHSNVNVLFHLNMLRLFQEIIIFFFEIKLVSNKNVSLKYLIQGFNPHLLS
jgi:hypothetical protein